jgi:ribosomal protein S12 methylthiotransferase accessory factor
MNGRKSIQGSFNELKGQNKELLDPNQIIYSTLKSQPKNKQNTSIDWVSGYNFSRGKKCFIPTQLIAVPYWDSGKETIWRAPITTGAATGSSIQAAIFNGLCEVIERDAFMVSWLRQLVVKRIINFKKTNSVTGDKHSQLLNKTLALLERYKLSPEFYLLPNDTQLPTVMCILKDTTKVGPPLTVGLDTDFSIVKTMLGALEESLQLRPWVRQVHDKKLHKPKIKNNKYDLYNLEQRASLWSSSIALKHLDKWLLNAEEIQMDEIKSYSSKETLKSLVDQISTMNATVYFSDLTKYTPKKVQDKKLFTVKVVIPEYQPLYLIEKYADYVRDRLFTAEKRLNCKSLLSGENLQTFPHPML